MIPVGTDDFGSVVDAQAILVDGGHASMSAALAAMLRCAYRCEVDLMSVAMLVNATHALPPEPGLSRGPSSTDVYVVARRLDARAQMARAQGTLMERDHSTALEALHDIHACADEVGVDASTVADVLVHTATSSHPGTTRR